MSHPQFSIKVLLLTVAFPGFFFAGYAFRAGTEDSKTQTVITRTPPPTEPCEVLTVFNGPSFEDIASFRQSLKEKISGEEKFGQGLTMLLEVNIDELIQSSSKKSYFAIASDPLIDRSDVPRLMGTDADFEKEVDWVIPLSGYQDTTSRQWPFFTRVFAKKYNLRLEKLGFGRQ